MLRTNAPRVKYSRLLSSSRSGTEKYDYVRVFTKSFQFSLNGIIFHSETNHHAWCYHYVSHFTLFFIFCNFIFNNIFYKKKNKFANIPGKLQRKIMVNKKDGKFGNLIYPFDYFLERMECKQGR